MAFRVFDASQPMEKYYAGKERQRVGGMAEYAQARQEKADVRAEEKYQREEAARPRMEAIATRKRAVESDKELAEFGKQQLQSMNPDAPDFNEQINLAVDDYTQHMADLGYDKQAIATQAERMFTSGALTPDGIRVAQEKAGIRRAPAKAPKAAAVPSGYRHIDPSNPRAGVEIIPGFTPKPVTGTTEFDRSVVDKVRARTLKKTKTSIKNASDLAGRLRGLITDDKGQPDSTILGIAGGAKKLAHGVTTQIDATRKAFVDYAGEGGDSVIALEFFNPKIGQAELVTNMLIYANAKANDPSGRVARDDFENEKRAMGASGALANAPDLLARIDVLDQIQAKRLADVNNELNPPKTVKSIEEAMKLPKGTVFITPDGKRKVR